MSESQRRGRVVGLDPYPSQADIERIYRQRTGQDLPILGASTFRGATAAQLDPAHTAPIRALRDGDTLSLVIETAPRTKKNSTTLGIKQSPAYRKYRDEIVAAIATVKLRLGLPLPPIAYNIAVQYYVDSRGKRADKVGLDQGLYDALENAGVVVDDWFFRTDDGTRIHVDVLPARVEILITPLDSPAPPLPISQE